MQEKPEILDAIVAAMLEAGAAILAIYDQNGGFETKQDGSPVTAADMAAERIVLAGLGRIDGAVPVVAEEAVAAGRVPEVGQRFYLVDPLDGTREFLSRNGEFTVNVALIEGGRPLAGAVYAPALGEVWAGAVGKGARHAKVLSARHGARLEAWQPIAARTPPPALDVVASRSHRTPETDAFIARWPVARLVSAGSSLKFCRLAEGGADLYPRLGRTMEWDTAAGDAVLTAAGGGVYTLDGLALRYGKRDQPDDADFANPWFVAAGAFNPFASSS